MVNRELKEGDEIAFFNNRNKSLNEADDLLIAGQEMPAHKEMVELVQDLKYTYMR